MKRFDHVRPLRDGNGEKTGAMPAPVFRMTRDALGGAFGGDGDKSLVVGLEAGDIISFRPAKTKRKVTATARDLYRAVLMWRANAAQLDYARTRKAELAAQRLDRARARETARLKREVRREA